MIAAHLILGLFFGLLSAGYVWFVLGAPFWAVLLAYWGAGSVACLVSGALAIVIAAICPGRREDAADCVGGEDVGGYGAAADRQR